MTTESVSGIVNAHGRADDDGQIRSFAIKGIKGFHRLSKYASTKDGDPPRLPPIGAEVDCDVNDKDFVLAVRIMSPARQANGSQQRAAPWNDRPMATRCSVLKTAMEYVVACGVPQEHRIEAVAKAYRSFLALVHEQPPPQATPDEEEPPYE